MNVYFISGIGADKRIFRNIRLPQGFNIFHLDWIKPLNDESLESYAIRLAEKIETDKPFILVGLSFGGMLAIEIARKYPQAKVILISSVPCYTHLPWYFKYPTKLKLHRLIPINLIKSASWIKRFFTAETKEEKAYLRRAIFESDSNFIRWGINAMVCWKNFEKPASSYIHIHGTTDEILPVRYTSPSHLIEGGGHLMILSKASEINNILKEILVSMHPVII